MALQREFMFAQDAFVQVRLKERNNVKVKPSVKDGLFLFNVDLTQSEYLSNDTVIYLCRGEIYDNF